MATLPSAPVHTSVRHTHRLIFWLGAQDLTTLRILEVAGIDAPEAPDPRAEQKAKQKQQRKVERAADFTTLDSVEGSAPL